MSKLGNMDLPSIRIIVATHKPYWMPEDPVYLPLLVGAEGKGIDWNGKKDNQGESISSRNPFYCELTGLYWAWKNLDVEALGLEHYRRLFANGKWWKKKQDRILSSEEFKSLLQENDILLPKSRHYWIETNYSQYAHAHHAEDLDMTRKILLEKYPEYIPAFDASMKKRSGHRFNMFVMKKGLLDEYCSWLFDILFELEKRLDISSYSKNDQRVFGFVAERLLDVWVETKKLAYKEIPYVFLENQNWLEKGFNFLKRKLKGKKE